THVQRTRIEHRTWAKPPEKAPKSVMHNILGHLPGSRAERVTPLERTAHPPPVRPVRSVPPVRSSGGCHPASGFPAGGRSLPGRRRVRGGTDATPGPRCAPLVLRGCPSTAGAGRPRPSRGIPTGTGAEADAPGPTLG